MRTAHAVGMLSYLDHKTLGDSGALAKIRLISRSINFFKLAAKLTAEMLRRMAAVSRAHVASTKLLRLGWSQAFIYVEAEAAFSTIISSAKQQTCPQWTPRQLERTQPVKGQPSQDTLSSSAKEISGLERPERLL